MGQVIVLFQGAVALSAPPPDATQEEHGAAFWAGLGSEFHVEIRNACARITQKIVAFDLGVDESTVSNWLACTPGRGFPPPRLILYLLSHPKTGADIGRWMMSRTGFLPPERPHVMGVEERLRRLEGALAANPDTQRAIYDRAYGSVRP